MNSLKGIQLVKKRKQLVSLEKHEGKQGQWKQESPLGEFWSKSKEVRILIAVTRQCAVPTPQ